MSPTSQGRCPRHGAELLGNSRCPHYADCGYEEPWEQVVDPGRRRADGRPWTN